LSFVVDFEHPWVASGPRSAVKAKSCGAIDVRIAAADTIDALVSGVIESFAGTLPTAADIRLMSDPGVMG